MGVVIPTFTDYAPDCGALTPELIKLLAQCVVTHDGHEYLNFIYHSAACGDITPYITCTTNGLEPEAVLAKIFALDECGNLGIKAILNTGEGQ